MRSLQGHPQKGGSPRLNRIYVKPSDSGSTRTSIATITSRLQCLLAIPPKLSQ